jgi:hypothetical protein
MIFDNLRGDGEDGKKWSGEWGGMGGEGSFGEYFLVKSFEKKQTKKTSERFGL